MDHSARFAQNDERELLAGCRALGIDTGAQQRRQWLDYLQLLVKWNRVHNLTAVRDPRQMLSRHLLDSLSIVPFIHGQSWLDVGSGGGLPGLPLAILFPERHFTLLDSNAKKSGFLVQAQVQLGLNNLSVVNERVENYRTQTPFDGILSRAFASLHDFVELTRHLGGPDCRWLAMKGPRADQELPALPEDFQLLQDQLLRVPGCQGQRRLLILGRTTLEVD